MRLRPLCLTALYVPSLLVTFGCSDNTPTYPAIVIYDTTGNGNSTGNGTGLTGSGASSSSGGSGNGASGGTSSGGSGTTTDPLYAHCNDLWSGQDPPVKTACDMNALSDAGEVSGDISKNTTWTTGHSYRLKGPVRVLPGVTLTIQPCVTVIGETSESTLAILSGALGDPAKQCYYDSGTPGPGGKLMAVGEPMAPIVFTSAKPKGQRAPSDWGGVLLLGNAHNNLALADDGATSGTRVPIEGLTRPECHGWHNSDYDAESSGKLEYVRIEYASRQLSADNETNGLSLASLGSGTELHYVEVSNSGDDCYEWFGGAVNADHLIALNCDDDMFDADNGFSGKLQFLFGRQYPTTTETDSRGFEIDGAPSLNNSPLTTEQASNFTLCGGSPSDKNTSRDGAVVRQYASGVSLTNGILTGFGGHGMFVDASSMSTHWSYVDMFDNTAGVTAPGDVQPGRDGEGPGLTQSWFLGQPGNTITEPDRFCNCWANPPVPVAASTGVGTSTKGFPDATANYVGAFKDSSSDSNWMRGTWVDWSSN